MPAFYPSLVVHLTLRFDPLLVPGQSEPLPRSAENLIRDPRTGLPVVVERPTLLTRSDHVASHITYRVPRKASIELPGYRQAGTFKLTFDFKDIPIDPRLIRAAGVEIHMGTIEPDAFARGMTARERPRASILNTTASDGTPRIDTLVLAGTVDEWDVEHSDSGSEISMEGRDMRGILLDSPTPPRILEAIDITRTIDHVVTQILSFHPYGELFQVQVNPAEWADGRVPAPSDPSIIPAHRRGVRGNTRAATNTDQNHQNFWDIIVRFCYLVGAIPYFAGTRLVIRPARSIFDQERAGFDPRIQTPFANGRPRELGGDQFSVRRFAYGRDIRRFSLKRKLYGTNKPRVIRAVSFDTSNQARGANRVVVGVWPPEALVRRAERAGNSRASSSAPHGGFTQEDIVTVPVPGIRDTARLTEVARSIFEQMGRNEVGGSFETKFMNSLGGSNADPDVTRLRPGDGVEFYVDTTNNTTRFPLVAAAVDHDRVSTEQLFHDLNVSLGDPVLARAIVVSSRGSAAQLQRFFRVSNVHFDWSAKDGLSINADFQNYIVDRYANRVDEVQSPGRVETRGTP